MALAISLSEFELDSISFLSNRFCTFVKFLGAFEHSLYNLHSPDPLHRAKMIGKQHDPPDHTRHGCVKSFSDCFSIRQIHMQMLTQRVILCCRICYRFWKYESTRSCSIYLGKQLFAPLAQLAEQVTLNHWVAGSIPARCKCLA